MLDNIVFQKDFVVCMDEIDEVVQNESIYRDVQTRGGFWGFLDYLQGRKLDTHPGLLPCLTFVSTPWEVIRKPVTVVHFLEAS